MSGLLAVVGPDPARRARPSLAALAPRGSEHAELRAFGPCVLGVRRFSWELDGGFSGNVLLAHEGADGGGAAVAADASLFYRGDLRRKLQGRGIRPASDAPAHLILAAYRAWGDACVEHLEGDFAFIVWDPDVRTLFAARDFNGKRPLFHAMIGDTFVVATTLRAVLAFPGCSDALDPVAVAEQAGGLTGSPVETCYRSIFRLPAGWSLRYGPGRAGPRAERAWVPPVFSDSARGSLDEGVEELREVLTGAIAERVSSDRPTAISLSGGHDSPIVFALGSAALSRASSSSSLLPISISYPSGDPGREDDMIQEICGRWGRSTTWIDSTGVRLSVDLEREAAERDEAFAHAFHRIFRRMMIVARGAGASVVLDGHGGDFLFQIASRYYYADLLRSGAWRELIAERRANGGGTWRELVRMAIIPLLSPTLISHLARARRRAIAAPGFWRQPPPWFRADFVARASLLERELAHQPPRNGMGMAAYESFWYLTAQPLTMASAILGDIALQEGVEGRSPFLDERMIRFAATRPRWERRSGGETKRLLRAAGGGLIPAPLLAPRRQKTGVMSRYFNDGCLALLDAVDPADAAPALTELGIVDAPALHRAIQRFQETDSNLLASRLLCTLHADAWLRSRRGSVDGAPGNSRTMTHRRRDAAMGSTPRS